MARESATGNMVRQVTIYFFVFHHSAHRALDPEQLNALIRSLYTNTR